MIDVVDDVIAAVGVTDIILWFQNTIGNFFTTLWEKWALASISHPSPKESLYQEVATLHKKENFTYYSNDSEAYGTVVPLRLAQPLLEQEEVFCVHGWWFSGQHQRHIGVQCHVADDVKPPTLLLLPPASANQGPTSKDMEDKTKMQGEVRTAWINCRKPKAETDAPDLVNISKYILSNQVFDILKTQTPNPHQANFT